MENEEHDASQGVNDPTEKFVEARHVCTRLLVPMDTPLECRITSSDHPYQFYVVPFGMEEPYIPRIKQFQKDYAEMTQEEMQEATPTGEFLSHAGAFVAVFYKSRWNRGIIVKPAGDSYLVTCLDTGDLETIQRSNIRQLYKKHLEFPAMAVRCSFLGRSEAEFLIQDEYARFFSHVTSANPNCEVTFRDVFEFDGALYWDADIEIKRLAGLPGSCRNESGSTEEKFNLLTTLASIHADRLNTENDLYFYINRF